MSRTDDESNLLFTSKLIPNLARGHFYDCRGHDKMRINFTVPSFALLIFHKQRQWKQIQHNNTKLYILRMRWAKLMLGLYFVWKFQSFAAERTVPMRVQVKQQSSQGQCVNLPMSHLSLPCRTWMQATPHPHPQLQPLQGDACKTWGKRKGGRMLTCPLPHPHLLCNFLGFTSVRISTPQHLKPGIGTGHETCPCCCLRLVI